MDQIKQIREFSIDEKGMHIGKPFRDVSGIISGYHQQSQMSSEIDRINNLFNADEGKM